MDEEFILTSSGEKYLNRLGDKFSQEHRLSAQEMEDNVVLSVAGNKGTVTVEDFLEFGGEKFHSFYKGIIRRLFEAGHLESLRD